MSTDVMISINSHKGIEQPFASFRADTASMDAARAFHRSIPEYKPTPLHSMRGLARRIGLRKVFLKDESARFGLNAFKALGASFAVAGAAARTLPGFDQEDSLPAFEKLRDMLKSSRRDPMFFVTATDGNHGRAVAWSARMLGAGAVVFMPKGAAAARVEAIRREGAEVIVTESNYDDAVRTAFKHATDNGGVIVQDTAWDGYNELPDMIMQGYLTMLSEISEQLTEMGERIPSHVILQAGVGSFAGSMLAGLECLAGEAMPIAVIAEPANAACYFLSSFRGDGGIAKVTGPLDTIMAGLACGEPNPRAWPAIMRLATAFAACGDCVAEEGMRILARPAGGDAAIVSGESGAIGAGLLSRIMGEPGLRQLRDALGFSGESSVLLISTEGDTDPEGYRRILQGEQATF